MKNARIVVCDDEYLIRLWLEEHLEEEGYDVRTVETGSGLLEALEEEPTDLVLLDLRLPDTSGIDLIPEIHELDPTIPVVMVTAYGEVEVAVAAVRAGAHHFLEKPVELPELLVVVEQALQTRKLLGRLERYREGNRWQFSDVTLVGRSEAMEEIAGVITRLGEKGSPANVLIRGESGAGKDVVARAIHARGPRGAGPFISVNCTALPEHLVESELFGHEPGAFTDAREEKRGLFELADGGTLFLDEIGDMPAPGQAKLLQVLETHEIRRVGGVRDIEIDVHVISATNRNLEAAVEAGDFREDLYYRLNVIPLEVPPLRARPEDIGPLALHFLEALSREMRTDAPRIAPETIRVLESYEWPGNARQLRNVLERILLLQDVETIEPVHLPDEIRGGDVRGDEGLSLPPGGVDLDALERKLIVEALERSDGNKTAAARLLGITRDTLRYRLEKYEIEVEEAGSA